MKNLNEYVNEMLVEGAKENIKEAEESIKSEKDLREAMKAKFKEVFGDELDEERMNNTIDGFCDDHRKEIEEGKFGELIGEFNESFAAHGKRE